MCVVDEPTLEMTRWKALEAASPTNAVQSRDLLVFSFEIIVTHPGLFPMVSLVSHESLVSFHRVV